MWKFGTGSVVFTPQEPFWMAGYAARKAPAKGKLSDLRAKALALEDEQGRRLLTLTIDLIAVQEGPTAGFVADYLHRKYGLERRQVLMGASHTHFGPEIRPDKAFFFGIPPEYEAKIVRAGEIVRQAMCRAADQALAELQPARLFVRKTSAGFADNRRAQGDVTDHDVPVLEVTDAQGGRRAVLFGYACHNTTIPPEDLRYCGDWAGFAQEQIEAENPGATALFLTGAAADQNPHPRGSVEFSRKYGGELAQAIVIALRQPGIEVEPKLGMAYEKVALPLMPIDREKLEANLKSTDPPIARKAKYLLDAMAAGQKLATEIPAPVQAIRFGNQLLLIALSGEPVNDYAHLIKREFQGQAMVWVAGYCNDLFGYVPTRRIQQEGGYEGGRANLWSWVPMPFDETVEERMIAGVRRAVEEL